MNTNTDYRATCGSLYRVTNRLRSATVIHACRFSTPCETNAAEVKRLVAISSFIKLPAP